MPAKKKHEIRTSSATTGLLPSLCMNNLSILHFLRVEFDGSFLSVVVAFVPLQKELSTKET